MCVSSRLAANRTSCQSRMPPWPLTYLGICVPSPPGGKQNIRARYDVRLRPLWACAVWGTQSDTAQFGRASCCVRLCHIWAGGFSSPTSAKQNPPVEQGSMLHITLNDHVCFKPPLWETWYSWWSECNLNFTLLGHVCLKPPWWGTGCSCRATYHVRLYPIRTCVCQVPWWGT